MRHEATIRNIERAMMGIARILGRRDLARHVERSLGSRVDASLLQVIGAIDELTEQSRAPTIKDIARHLDVHHSRASRVVKDTIRAGFVTRLASQEDARKSPLALSDKGREIASALCAARAKFFTARLHSLSKSDKRNLARLLERFVANGAEAHRKKDPEATASPSLRKIRKKHPRKRAA